MTWSISVNSAARLQAGNTQVRSRNRIRSAKAYIRYSGLPHLDFCHRISPARWKHVEISALKSTHQQVPLVVEAHSVGKGAMA